MANAAISRRDVKRVAGLKRVSEQLRSASRLSLLGAVLIGGLPGAALAQNAPVISAPTRDELVPVPARIARPQSTLTIDGQMQRTACALDNPDFADIRVTLSQVSFVGAEAASDVSLAAAYDGYIGQELPISVLCDIRSRATQLLSDAGYLAAVEIPEQRLAEGAAEFRVVLGRLTALRVRGDAGPSETLLAGYLQRLVDGEAFNSKSAERYLLLADDIPGLNVRLSLRPVADGAPGDLIGEIAVLRRRGALDFNIQNFGSNALGRYAGLLRAELYDLTGMGDRTTIALYSTADFEEQQTLQLGHDFRVGSDGLTLGGQLTFGWTNPSLGLTGFDVKSDTMFASLRASYPLMRTQSRSIHSSFGVDIVNQNVDVNGLNLARDRVRTAWARMDLVETDLDSIARREGYTPFEPRARIAAGVEVRQGLDIFGTSPDCRAAAAACVAANNVPSRIEQDPTPLLIRADLQTEYRPVPLVTIALDMQAQFTSDPLPAFEEFTGGNYSIGRGFDPGAVTGDRGFGTSLELRYGSIVPKSVESIALQPFVFADYVRVWDRDPSRRPFNPNGLLSIGGGVRFTHGGGVQGDVAVAVPLERTNTQPTRGDVRVLFSLTTRLLPWRF